MTMNAPSLLKTLSLVTLALVSGCQGARGGNTGATPDGGGGKDAGSSSGGGTSGSGGSSSGGGTSGSGGSSGRGDTSGTSGSGGSSGGGGTSGTSGTGGSLSDGGTSGTGGSSSDGSTSGTGGSSSDGGTSDAPATTDGPTISPFPIPVAHPPMTSDSKLDLLFMVDDSASMAPLQAKLRAKISSFIDVLKSVPGGLPDLHLAVVSSSLGAGKYGNVPGCMPGTPGNANGAFQHSPACPGLHAGQSFITSAPGTNGTRSQNFDGDIAEVFRCIANLGDKGCGFEHQFASVQLALQRTEILLDTNAGFLREDAYLGVIMLTNEDDCSVDQNSDLFDPAQYSVNDPSMPYGGLQSYRCNEFGHRCDQPMPHNANGLPMTMTGCTSNEQGKLVSVGGFLNFLFSLKPTHPETIFVAAIAGMPTPYSVAARTFTLPTGVTEAQPTVDHSCTEMTGEYADPAVRIKSWTEAFGPNSFFGSICDADFGATLDAMARRMVAP